MATLRNKTTSEGVIVRWKPYPDHGRPSTYQVTNKAVSFLAELGFRVPNSGDEAEIPWDVCRPLRILGDLYFKSHNSEEVETKNISDIDENFAQSLSKSQRNKLRNYITSHNEYQEHSGELDGEISSLATGDDTGNERQVIDSSELEFGHIMVAEIDRVASSDNGIIETDSGHINVGPVSEDAAGSEIMIEVVTSSFAICVTEDVRSDDYTNKFWKINRSVFHKYGEPKIHSAQFCTDCGSVALKYGDVWRCGTCGTEMTKEEPDRRRSDSDDSDTNLPNSGTIFENVSLSTDSNMNICLESDERVKINGNVNLNESVDVKVETERDGYVVASVITEEETKSLDRLRREAKQAATENVSTKVSESTSTTVRYTRSQRVKDYVKARADGICEGCKEPAPFTSTTGKPYLHAHHIHELSEGGSDTPDTVIALCPNCHYRIHHGEDGGEYNQKLADKIQKKESNILD